MDQEVYPVPIELEKQRQVGFSNLVQVREFEHPSAGYRVGKKSGAFYTPKQTEPLSSHTGHLSGTKSKLSQQVETQQLRNCTLSRRNAFSAKGSIRLSQLPKQEQQVKSPPSVMLRRRASRRTKQANRNTFLIDDSLYNPNTLCEALQGTPSHDTIRAQDNESFPAPPAVKTPLATTRLEQEAEILDKHAIDHEIHPVTETPKSKTTTERSSFSLRKSTTTEAQALDSDNPKPLSPTIHIAPMGDENQFKLHSFDDFTTLPHQDLEPGSLVNAMQDLNMHSILHVGESESGDSSTVCTDDSPWGEDFELSLEEDQSRLTTPSKSKSPDELELLKEAYTDEKHPLKEASAQNASKKLESFKIKWSFKRRKKKRQIIKVSQRSRKILLLGDMNTGKSNLITTYCKDRYFESHFPTILHFCCSDAKVMRRTFDIVLADTSGRDDFKPLRKCAYPKTDIAVLCYSAADRNTLKRIETFWLPELRAHAPNVPFIIAENKKDLREELEDQKMLMERDGLTGTSEYERVSRELADKVTPLEEGMKMAEELGAEAFFSTSARYRVGTRKLFQSATVLAVKKSRRMRLK